MSNDHRSNITQAALGEGAALADLVAEAMGEDEGTGWDVLGTLTLWDVTSEAMEALDSWALDVDVMISTKDPHRWRVEVLTGCGGPTTSWVADSRDGLTFSHSWGVDDEGQECTTVGPWWGRHYNDPRIVAVWDLCQIIAAAHGADVEISAPVGA